MPSDSRTSDSTNLQIDPDFPAVSVDAASLVINALSNIIENKIHDLLPHDKVTIKDILTAKGLLVLDSFLITIYNLIAKFLKRLNNAEGQKALNLHKQMFIQFLCDNEGLERILTKASQ